MNRFKLQKKLNFIASKAGFAIEINNFLMYNQHSYMKRLKYK